MYRDPTLLIRFSIKKLLQETKEQELLLKTFILIALGTHGEIPQGLFKEILGEESITIDKSRLIRKIQPFYEVHELTHSAIYDHFMYDTSGSRQQLITLLKKQLIQYYIQIFTVDFDTCNQEFLNSLISQVRYLLTSYAKEEPDLCASLCSCLDLYYLFVRKDYFGANKIFNQLTLIKPIKGGVFSGYALSLEQELRKILALRLENEPRSSIQEALAFYKKVLDRLNYIYKFTNGTFPSSMVKLCYEMATIWQQQGAHIEAMELLEPLIPLPSPDSNTPIQIENVDPLLLQKYAFLKMLHSDFSGPSFEQNMIYMAYSALIDYKSHLLSNIKSTPYDHLVQIWAYLVFNQQISSGEEEPCYATYYAAGLIKSFYIFYAQPLEYPTLNYQNVIELYEKALMHLQKSNDNNNSPSLAIVFCYHEMGVVSRLMALVENEQEKLLKSLFYLDKAITYATEIYEKEPLHPNLAYSLFEKGLTLDLAEKQKITDEKPATFFTRSCEVMEKTRRHKNKLENANVEQLSAIEKIALTHSNTEVVRRNVQFFKTYYPKTEKELNRTCVLEM